MTNKTDYAVCRRGEEERLREQYLLGPIARVRRTTRNAIGDEVVYYPPSDDRTLRWVSEDFLNLP